MNHRPPGASATGAVLAIVLVRPTNGLVLLALPVLWGSGTRHVRSARSPSVLCCRLRSCARGLDHGGPSTAPVESCRPAIAGNGAGGEGFHGAGLRCSNVLFSWRKGCSYGRP